MQAQAQVVQVQESKPSKTQAKQAQATWVNVETSQVNVPRLVRLVTLRAD